MEHLDRNRLLTENLPMLRWAVARLPQGLISRLGGLDEASSVFAPVYVQAVDAWLQNARKKGFKLSTCIWKFIHHFAAKPTIEAELSSIRVPSHWGKDDKIHTSQFPEHEGEVLEFAAPESQSHGPRESLFRLRVALRCLTRRERHAVTRHFVDRLDKKKEEKTAGIARTWGLPRERVEEIRDAGLARLKRILCEA